MSNEIINGQSPAPLILITKDGRFGIPPFCDTNFNIIVEYEGQAKELKQGMMTALDIYLLSRLCKRLPNEFTALEVGSFIGTSTCLIGEYAKARNGKVIAIDNFKGNPTSALDIESMKLKPEDVERMLRCNLRSRNLENVVKINKCNSDEYKCSDKLDMIFLDGDHRCSYVLGDMERFWPFLNDGGILCGHDFDDPCYHDDYVEVDYAMNKEGTACVHHGVAKALYDFQTKYGVEVCKFENDEIIPDASRSSIWFIIKRDLKLVQITPARV